MSKIQWRVFDRGFKVANQNHFTLSQISKSEKISRSYLYHLFSKNNHPDTITYQMAYRIGRGTGMTPQKSQNWTKKLLRHTLKPQLGKSSQRSKKLTYRSHHKSGKSEHDLSKSESAYVSVKHIENRHPVVKFCPVNRDGLSDLALHVKQLMGDKQISMKNLCKITYLNKQRLHDLFNGKQKTVDKLTAVRIADGLDIPPNSLFAYNHYTPKIKAVVMDSSDDGSLTDRPLTEQIRELNSHDTELIRDMVSRLLVAENHEDK